MELVKLKKPVRKVKKNFTKEGLERKRKVARNQMIFNNPMHREDVRMKVLGHPQRNTGRTYFKKGNKLGRKTKGKKHSPATKMNHSIKMKGRKLHSEEHKEELKRKMKENNPMKNPEVVKKNMEARKRNRKKRYSEKRRFICLTNPKIREVQFKKGDKRLMGNKWCVGRVPWNKGLTKETMGEYREKK